MVKRLQLLLKYYKLSASNFADRINVPRSSISHLLSGRNKPSLDFIMKVVEAFEDVDINWLVYGKDGFPKAAEGQLTPVLEKPTEVSLDLFSTPPTKDNLVVKTSKSKKKNILIEEQIPIKNNLEPIQDDIQISSLVSVTDKKLKKIVLLYDDGSFEEYNK